MIWLVDAVNLNTLTKKKYRLRVEASTELDAFNIVEGSGLYVSAIRKENPHEKLIHGDSSVPHSIQAELCENASRFDSSTSTTNGDIQNPHASKSAATNWIPSKTRPQNDWAGAGVLIIAILIASVFFCHLIYPSSSQSRSSGDESTSTNGDGQSTLSSDIQAQAWTVAKDAVESQLKAPATESFPWLDYTVTKHDSKYYVVSYVDAENSFGAKIRTKFVVVEDTGFRVQDVSFDSN
jgi:hypothetical protein